MSHHHMLRHFYFSRKRVFHFQSKNSGHNQVCFDMPDSSFSAHIRGDHRKAHPVQAGVYILRYVHLVRNNTMSPYQRSNYCNTATEGRWSGM